jgi:hypothetical protein
VAIPTVLARKGNHCLILWEVEKIIKEIKKNSSLYTRETLNVFVSTVGIATQARNDMTFYLLINFKQSV